MVNWDKYEQLVTSIGKTRRDKDLHIAMMMAHKYLPDNPSCKDVKINGVDRKLIVHSSTKSDVASTDKKEFNTLPQEMCYLGDLIEWAGQEWLVINADVDSEYDVDGVFQLCNYKLRWQNKDLDIIETPVVKLSSGVTSEFGSLISTGENKVTVLLPFNDETLKIQRNKRFFIDNNKENPTPYKVTGIDNTTKVIGTHGVIQLILEEDQLDKDKDNIELMICDYQEKSDSPTTIPSNIYKAKIEAKTNRLYCKYSKGLTLNGVFENEDGTLYEAVPQWDIVCDFMNKLEVNKNGVLLSLKMDDEAYLGQHILVKLCDKNNPDINDSLILEVCSLG